MKIGAVAHRLCRLIWKILHQGIRYEERGPAVSEEAKKARARKMIRELGTLGYHVDLRVTRSDGVRGFGARDFDSVQCPRVGDNVEPMALTEHDLAAIRAAIEKDTAAVRRADWDAITRMFTADAIRFPPHQPPIRGRAAMRAWLETFPPFEEFAIRPMKSSAATGSRFVRGTYEMTIGGPKPVTDRGNYMGLMRKQPDGSWLWTTDMAVSELPAPMA
jgi:ketosteroid isomerase-like protein